MVRPDPRIAKETETLDPYDPMHGPVFQEFLRVAKSIQHAFPVYPVRGDMTYKGIQNFPGYVEFCNLDPQTRYFYFVNALMGNLRATAMLEALDHAVEKKI